MRQTYTTTQALHFLEIQGRIITSSRLRQLLRKNRFKGAYKHGRDWVIPLTSLEFFLMNSK